MTHYRRIDRWECILCGQVFETEDAARWHDEYIGIQAADLAATYAPLVGSKLPLYWSYRYPSEHGGKKWIVEGQVEVTVLAARLNDQHEQVLEIDREIPVLVGGSFDSDGTESFEIELSRFVPAIHARLSPVVYKPPYPRLQMGAGKDNCRRVEPQVERWLAWVLASGEGTTEQQPK